MRPSGVPSPGRAAVALGPGAYMDTRWGLAGYSSEFPGDSPVATKKFPGMLIPQ